MVTVTEGLILSWIVTILSDAFFSLLNKPKEKGEDVEELRNRLERLFDKVATQVLAGNTFAPEEHDPLKELLLTHSRALREQFTALLSLESDITPVQEDGSSFSNEAIRRLFIRFRDSKGIQGVSDATISEIVPELITRTIQEMSLDSKLCEYVSYIRNSNIIASLDPYFKKVLSELSKLNKSERDSSEDLRNIVCLLQDLKLRNDITPEIVDDVVEFINRDQKDRSSRIYDEKVFFGRPTHEIRSHFRYLPPRLIKVKPGDFGDSDRKVSLDRSKSLSEEKLLEMILKKKNVFIIAGAGVGKTTFLLHLHLSILGGFFKHNTLSFFADVKDVFNSNNLIYDYVEPLLMPHPPHIQKDKMETVFNKFHYEGRLLLLLDSLDQTDELTGLNKFLRSRGASTRILVTCREEALAGDPVTYKTLFQDFEWVYLDEFSTEELIVYLDPDLSRADFNSIPEDVQNLLHIRFYAAAAKRIWPAGGDKHRMVTSRTQLLGKFVDYLFQEVKWRPTVPLQAHLRPRIEEFLYLLSFDTLCDSKIQNFPYSFLKDYRKDWDKIIELVFKTHWVFFRHCLFDSKDELSNLDHQDSQYLCSFYHQLLQEYFAACRLKQLFDKKGDDRSEFDEALAGLPFSEVVLDLLDDLLPDEAVFNHCMDRFYKALEWANKNRQGIQKSGHKFTWLLALRDRKGRKPGLKDELQAIFDRELEKSRRQIQKDGDYVKIPAGAFLMGGYEFDREQPVRVVYLSAFWISMYAETFEEYDKYCRAAEKGHPKDRDWGRGKRPVINVSWEDADGYRMWKGDDYRLPTEAQWEKASRGCLGRRFPWGNDEPDKDKANVFITGSDRTVEVDSYGEYMYGLYHMSGNVWEWCRDYYGDRYSPEEVTDPVGPGAGSFRVYRGGGWFSAPIRARSANRNGDDPGFRSGGLGFRLARSC